MAWCVIDSTQGNSHAAADYPRRVVDALAWIGERRIEAAIRAGAFDRLPGMGRPLALDDLDHVAPELRQAFLVLRNAGCLGDETGAGVPVTTLAPLLAACGARDPVAALRLDYEEGRR